MPVLPALVRLRQEDRQFISDQLGLHGEKLSKKQNNKRHLGELHFEVGRKLMSVWVFTGI